MRAKFWLVAVVAVVLAQSAVARNIAGQTQPSQFKYDDGYVVMGRGAGDCGRMTSDLRSNREEWEPDYMNYAQGFLTGANFHASTTKRGNPNVGQATSHQALLAALEQYCGQHPLASFGDALALVYFQLAVK